MTSTTTQVRAAILRVLREHGEHEGLHQYDLPEEVSYIIDVDDDRLMAEVFKMTEDGTIVCGELDPEMLSLGRAV
jgi:hypothetical protein